MVELDREEARKNLDYLKEISARAMKLYIRVFQCWSKDDLILK